MDWKGLKNKVMKFFVPEPIKNKPFWTLSPFQSMCYPYAISGHIIIKLGKNISKNLLYNDSVSNFAANMTQ